MELGNFSLVTAWLLTLYGLIGGAYGAWKGKESLIRSARNSVYLVAFLTVTSLTVLGIYFLQHDYRYMYVWRTSNNDMSPIYLIGAIWGGMDGSMLLWAGIMAIYAAIVVYRTSGRVQRDLMSWVVPMLMGATNFFLFVVTFLTNPFRLVPGLPTLTDGNGLNPLLQNPSMMIHPPCLYAGFTGFMIPFAFALAALLSGHLSDAWIIVTRRWTLIAWGFLTAGIILGGNWAYIELGWGGFWAWDPVENSSFLPWLTATAYIHSVMVQERRGMLKVWNISLSVITYLLTVFGTFLTRSGIVQSVHAFAETDIGWVFLLYLGSMLFFAIVLISYRWNELRPDNKLESYFSREAAFLFNNLALLGICFATFWGVMFPVISEAIAGEKSVVGPPFFNQVNVPVFLMLIFLMGVGPLIAWRRSSFKSLIRLFLRPLISGSLITLLFLFLDRTRILSAVGFGLATFAIGTVMGEFHRGIKIRRQLTEENYAQGLINLVRRKPHRYGGFIVHLGVGIMTIAIIASMAYKNEQDFSIAIGERYTIDRFSLELESVREEQLPNYAVMIAKVIVRDRKTDEVLGTLTPERRFYKKSEETTTEVDIRITPREDLYLALAGLDNGRSIGTEGEKSPDIATFKVFVNPLQVWLWFGGIIVLFGTVIVINPLGESRVALVTRDSRFENESLASSGSR